MSVENSVQEKEKTGILFLSGAGLDGSIWRSVADKLDYPYLIAEYPGREETMEARKHLSLNDYVHYVKRQAEERAAPKFVIVAHSIGGVVGLRLASELSDRVAGFIAVGATIPRKGGSFLSALPLPNRILMSVILRIAGTKPPKTSIRSGLCNDLSEEQTEAIVKSYTPEAKRLFTDPVHVALPAVPTLYAKLADDKELSPASQDKMISNLSSPAVRTLNTGHLPMLSAPGELRAIIDKFMSDISL